MLESSGLVSGDDENVAWCRVTPRPAIARCCRDQINHRPYSASGHLHPRSITSASSSPYSQSPRHPEHCHSRPSRRPQPRAHLSSRPIRHQPRRLVIGASLQRILCTYPQARPPSYLLATSPSLRGPCCQPLQHHCCRPQSCLCDSLLSAPTQLHPTFADSSSATENNLEFPPFARFFPRYILRRRSNIPSSHRHHIRDNTSGSGPARPARTG
jgi:hypothetical protein